MDQAALLHHVPLLDALEGCQGHAAGGSGTYVGTRQTAGHCSAENDHISAGTA